MEWLKGKVKNEEGAKYFFEVFRFEDGNSITEQKQKEYKANAEILNAIKSCTTVTRQQKSIKNSNFGHSYQKKFPY